MAWLYTCARRALKLARRYSVADGKEGLRARGCLAQVKVYRKDIRGLRDVRFANERGMPGLTKTRVGAADEKQASRAG